MNAHARISSTPSNIELLEQIEHLREENRQLREVLAPPIAFPAPWRLSSSEAEVLAAIHATKGYVCTKERIYHALYAGRHEDEWAEPKIVDVLVCKVRRKLMEAQARVTILTSWGRGYRLESESYARLTAILAAEREVYALPPLLARPRLVAGARW